MYHVLQEDCIFVLRKIPLIRLSVNWRKSSQRKDGFLPIIRWSFSAVICVMQEIRNVIAVRLQSIVVITEHSIKIRNIQSAAYVSCICCFLYGKGTSLRSSFWLLLGLRRSSCIAFTLNRCLRFFRCWLWLWFRLRFRFGFWLWLWFNWLCKLRSGFYNPLCSRWFDVSCCSCNVCNTQKKGLI